MKRVMREGNPAARLLFAGIFVYLTGYLISVSRSFPRELRYQKIKEKKRKKAKTAIFLFNELTPFPFRRIGSFSSFVSNGCKIKRDLAWFFC
jgi:hypothetical protein